MKLSLGKLHSFKSNFFRLFDILFIRYTSGYFTNQFIATIGIDYAIKNLKINKRNFRVKIWDTAGQERYRSLTKNFFVNADGVIILYDITDKNSFEKVKSWIHSVNEYSKLKKSMILVGNKVDLSDLREVSSEDGRLLAELYNIPFYETSAKDNTSVEEAFENLITCIAEQFKPEESKDEQSFSGLGFKRLNCCM